MKEKVLFLDNIKDESDKNKKKEKALIEAKNLINKQKIEKVKN